MHVRRIPIAVPGTRAKAPARSTRDRHATPGAAARTVSTPTPRARRYRRPVPIASPAASTPARLSDGNGVLRPRSRGPRSICRPLPLPLRYHTPRRFPSRSSTPRRTPDLRSSKKQDISHAKPPVDEAGVQIPPPRPSPHDEALFAWFSPSRPRPGPRGRAGRSRPWCNPGSVGPALRGLAPQPARAPALRLRR